jgi:hypothetical protein
LPAAVEVGVGVHEPGEEVHAGEVDFFVAGGDGGGADLGDDAVAEEDGGVGENVALELTRFGGQLTVPISSDLIPPPLVVYRRCIVQG